MLIREFGGAMNQRTSIFHGRALLHLWSICAAVLLAVMLLGAARLTAATTCENLASLALPNATIDSAQMVAAGAFVQPGGRGGAARGEGGAGRGAADGRGVRGGGPAANPFASLPAF